MMTFKKYINDLENRKAAKGGQLDKKIEHSYIISVSSFLILGGFCFYKGRYLDIVGYALLLGGKQIVENNIADTENLERMHLKSISESDFQLLKDMQIIFNRSQRLRLVELYHNLVCLAHSDETVKIINSAYRDANLIYKQGEYISPEVSAPYIVVPKLDLAV